MWNKRTANQSNSQQFALITKNKTKKPTKCSNGIWGEIFFSPGLLHRSEVINLKINNMAQNVKDAVYKDRME